MKKYISHMIALIMILQSVLCVLPVSAKGNDGMFESYSWDFSMGRAYWSFLDADVKDGRAYMRNDFSMFNAPEELTWKDYTLEFDWQYLKSHPEGWFRFNVRGA